MLRTETPDVYTDLLACGAREYHDFAAVGSHLVTITGNIPLNKALAASEGGDDSAAREAFESCWNNLHRIRTALSLAASALLAAAAV